MTCGSTHPYELPSYRHPDITSDITLGCIRYITAMDDGNPPSTTHPYIHQIICLIFFVIIAVITTKLCLVDSFRQWCVRFRPLSPAGADRDLQEYNDSQSTGYLFAGAAYGTGAIHRPATVTVNSCPTVKRNGFQVQRVESKTEAGSSSPMHTISVHSN